MFDSILDLPAGTRWVLQDDENLKLRKAKSRAGKMEIPQAMSFALALTEKCVEIGQGMIYYLQPHPRSDHLGRTPASVFFDAYLAIKSVPQLFYIPKRWTSEEKETWNQFTPLQQLHRLDSRHGWLDDTLSVMPLVVNYQEEVQVLPTFDGFTDGLITVDLSPQHYLVGPTSDIRGLCDRVWQVVRARVPERNQQPRGTTFVAKAGFTWQDFARWQVAGLDEVMREVDRICRGVSVSCTVLNPFQSLGSLRLEAIEAARVAHTYDQDYAYKGTKSDWKAGVDVDVRVCLQ